MIEFKYRFAATLLNLIVPGAGLGLLGRWLLAWSIMAALVGAFLIIAWFRIILEPWGLPLYGAILVGAITLSAIGCWFVPPPSSFSIRHTLSVVLFVVIQFSLLTVGFITKPHSLGIQVYFVPSMSMHPTLQPGQFILVDTWAYRDHSPQLNDIVVFKLKHQERWLVKRIIPWPDGQLTRQGQWFVTGDNRPYSQGSQDFGGVTREQLMGKVALILLRVDQHQTIYGPYLYKPNSQNGVNNE